MVNAAAAPPHTARREGDLLSVERGAGDANPAELLDRLADIPNRLDAAVAALGAHDTAVVADGWTARELTGHLGDSSRLWGARMRMVALEDRPRLVAYDQDTFVRLAAYRHIPARDLARQFRAASEPLIAFLRELGPVSWDRAGVHDERGELTLRDIVSLEVAHEVEHVEQLERMSASVG